MVDFTGGPTNPTRAVVAPGLGMKADALVTPVRLVIFEFTFSKIDRSFDPGACFLASASSSVVIASISRMPFDRQRASVICVPIGVSSKPHSSRNGERDIHEEITECHRVCRHGIAPMTIHHTA